MLRRFFRTIPKGLNLLAFASLAVLLLKVFMFNHIREPVRGFFELGVVFEGLLASIFASYVFYLIVVHIREVRDQAVISPHITKWAERVVGDCRSQLIDFTKASGIDLTLDALTKDTATAALSKIDPHANAALVFALNHYANWLQYWDYHRTRSKDYIAKIMAQLTFLDAQLVALLTAIDDSSHFFAVQTVARTQIRNTDMSAFASSFYDYCVACRDLGIYLDATKA
jgi:hypothetical protein